MRVAQLNAAFSMIRDTLPPDARRYELHELIAIFIHTPEEAYYMGNLVRDFINTLDREPFAHSAN